MPHNISNTRQRMLSLWLNRLSTDRVQRSWANAGRTTSQQPRASSTPVVIVGKRGNAERIVALDDKAERCGLRAGLALAEARAMHPSLVAIEEDAGADARLLAKLADWSGRYTPLVALDPPDGLMLDIAGCAHLFGGEERLCDNLLSNMRRFGIAARASIADTIGAAWALARFSSTSHAPSGKEPELLAPLPLAALQLPPATVSVLARLGLKQIGDIIEMPRAPLVARFGEDLLRQLDRALGRESQPLSPRLPVPAYSTEQHFPEPITQQDDVMATILRLASRQRELLEKRGEGARRIELCLFRTDGAVRRITIGASHPIRDPQDVRALFAERLSALADEYDPGFGFDLARLSVLISEAMPPEQISVTDDSHTRSIERLADRLAARLGAHRVRRIVAGDSHIPELSAAFQPAQHRRPDVQGWEDFRRYSVEAAIPSRPLRLLVKPEPIEAIAAVPDGPPLRFRWRRALHEVAAAEGPERIECVWWNEEGGRARDYFRVEDHAGYRFWLFRSGLYREATGAAPSWFMHGLFA